MSEYIIDMGNSSYQSTSGLLCADVSQLREEIVRCRDCKYAMPEPESDAKFRSPYQGGYWCDELSEGIGLFCDPDCFCSWGERRAEK